MIRVKGKSKGQGRNTKYTHYERQLQHAWELMRQRQKTVEAENKAEWDRGSSQFLVFVVIMLVSLFGMGELIRWLCGA